MRHWKVLITTFAILAIGGLLFFRYGHTGLGDTFSSFLGKLNPAPSGSAFPIELDTSLSAYQGKSLDIGNISVGVEAPCIFTKPPNNFDFERKAGVCTFSLDSTSGKVSFESGVVFDTDVLGVNVQPGTVYIGGLAANKLSLLGVNGEIKIFQNSTWVTVPLEGKNIDISNMVGNMRIEGNTVTLNALATSVVGQSGNGPGFKWSG